MQTKDLIKDELILEWFLTCSIKEHTQRSYLSGMKLYTELIGKTPRELKEEAEAEETLPKGKRHVRSYLLRFKAFLEGKKPNGEPKYSSGSAAVRWSAVLSFYKAFDIDLPRNIKSGDVLLKVENMNLRFGKEDIKKMLMHCTNARDRAIILTMKSSGMAQEEIRNLTYKQFRDGYDRITEIATIYMRRAKVGVDFITFIDPEGTKAIIEYLISIGRATREGYFDNKFDSLPLFTLYRRKTGKIEEDMFMFVFRQLAVKARQHTTAKKGETYVYNPLRSHNLRKFFRVTLLHDGMDDTLINYLMGHKPSRLSRAYYYSDVDKLKKLYMQHLQALSINSNGTDLDLFNENQRLKAEMSKIKTEKPDETPEKAFMDMLEDERLVKQLYEKLKAFAPSG